MNYAEFRARAQEIFDDIPPQYREGVDGLEVSRATVAHPTLPGIYTLGECKTESYPTEFGGAGEVRSIVALYYGSFLALARASDDWDWEGELWETVTHEVRHHLESLATDDSLEVMDYAEDQNFARREGEPFDPLFYRMGHARGPGVYEVDGDLFFEQALGDDTPRDALSTTLAGSSVEVCVPLPDDPADVHFLRLLSPAWSDETDRVLVLLRQRSVWERLGALLRGAPPSVRIEEVEVLPPTG